MNRYFLYSLYMRFILLLSWFAELWNRMFFVVIIEKDDGVYARIRDKHVRLELYQSNSAEGFLIGSKYYTTIKPIVFSSNRTYVCDESDQD